MHKSKFNLSTHQNGIVLRWKWSTRAKIGFLLFARLFAIDKNVHTFEILREKIYFIYKYRVPFLCENSEKFYCIHSFAINLSLWSFFFEKMLLLQSPPLRILSREHMETLKIKFIREWNIIFNFINASSWNILFYNTLLVLNTECRIRTIFKILLFKNCKVLLGRRFES